MKTKEYFQGLTLAKLEELMEYEAKKGNSKLDLSKYELGTSMRAFLESKGFIVYESSKSNRKSISW